MSTLHEAKIYPTSGVDAGAYRKATYALAASIRIKNSYAAKLLNKAVTALYGPASVDLSSPETWVYNLNQSGEYHWFNGTMVVSSIDTGEEILFSKDNLSIHKNTAVFYALGGTGYHTLLARFPSQKLLIDSILHPAELDAVLAADDGGILAYQRSLVEPWEKRLLPALEAWIKVFNHRWHIPGFAVTDKYYIHAQAAVLATQLPARIMLERLRAVKTQEAHSFHVRAYLASNGGLDDYFPFLTRNQALWLYQNIQYLDHQRGQEKTLLRLVSHLLDEVGFGASSISGVQRESYVDGYPVYSYVPKTLTKTYHSPQDRTIKKLYADGRDIASGNDDFQEALVSEQTAHLTSAVLKTKVVDISHVDYQNSERFTMENIAIDAWGYLAIEKKRYNIRFLHTTPVSRKTTALSMADAFTYFIALLVWRTSAEQVNFPAYLVRMYPEDVAESNHRMLHNAPDAQWTTKALGTIRSAIPVPSRILIQSSFVQHCRSIHSWFMRTERAITYGAGSETEAQRSHIVQSFIPLKPIELPEEPIVQWAARKGLDVVTDPLLIDNVLNELYEMCTGINMNPVNDVSIRHAHLSGLLKRLSSYSIQFIGSCNSYPAYCQDHLRYTPSTPKRHTVVNVGNQRLLCNQPRASVVRKASPLAAQLHIVDASVISKRLPVYETRLPMSRPERMVTPERSFNVSLPIPCITIEVPDAI